jgi:orotate phosphoribosyltransferase
MIATIEELRRLDPALFNVESLTSEEILRWLVLAEAGWMHNDDPKMPHAELASGMCSNGYFFCRKLLRFPNINEILGKLLTHELVIALKKANLRADAVVGSPYSAITISYEVARSFCVPHGIPEKDPSDPKGKKMIWKEEFPAGTRILRVEELVTTSGTTLEVTRAIQEQNPHPVSFLPIVGVLVHRPPLLPMDYWNMQIVPLVEKEIWAVPPDQCPLCRQGSVRVKPKANWALLTGKA